MELIATEISFMQSVSKRLKEIKKLKSNKKDRFESRS